MRSSSFAFLLAILCTTATISSTHQHAHALPEDPMATTTAVPYFLFNVRTDTLNGRDVLTKGISVCLDLDATSTVELSAYSTHSLDDTTVVTLQFEDSKWSRSMQQFISTVNGTIAAKECLHEKCDNLVIYSIRISYDIPTHAPQGDKGSFFAQHPYVFVGGGAVVLALMIVGVVVVIKMKEEREKAEYVEPLATMEQGRQQRGNQQRLPSSPPERGRQAADVERRSKVSAPLPPKTTTSPPQAATPQAATPLEEAVVVVGTSSQQPAAINSEEQTPSPAAEQMSSPTLQTDDHIVPTTSQSEGEEARHSSTDNIQEEASNNGSTAPTN